MSPRGRMQQRMLYHLEAKVNISDCRNNLPTLRRFSHEALLISSGKWFQRRGAATEKGRWPYDFRLNFCKVRKFFTNMNNRS